MKSIFKLPIILVLCVFVLASTIITAIAATIISADDYVIKVDEENGYTSLSGWNSSGVLTVPNSVKKYYISEIADYAFSDREDISGLDMSNAYTLKRIGIKAFDGCNGISGDLVIPNRVTEIGLSAFESCTGIESVTVYSGIKTIPAQMCYDCTGLKSVTLSYGIETIGRLAFADCPSLENVKIPLTVTSIDSLAFYHCPNLVIYCYTDSYAHQYAVDNGFNYVLIDAPVPTEPSTEPPTDAPTEPPTDVPEPITFMLGDADGDGMVTILDATKIQRILVDLDTDDDGMITLRSLVDGADTLNIMHATKIQRWIAGFKTDDPIGEIVTG